MSAYTYVYIISCPARRNGGLDARSREGGGRAGERERERAGFFANEVQETRRDKRARVSEIRDKK